jgi:hypothetical protein
MRTALLADRGRFARLIFPRLKGAELGRNLFLLAAGLYGALLSLAFPAKQ